MSDREYIQAQIENLKKQFKELPAKPERFNGCECARWENHEGRCYGLDCNCHS